MGHYNEQVRLASFVALRFLRRRSSPLLTASSRAALVAVAFGVAALLVVLGLMNGYRQALQEGILGVAGHVLLWPEAQEEAQVVDKLKGMEGVVWAGAVHFLPGLLAREPGAPGEVITLKATDHLPSFSPLEAQVKAGPLPVAVGRGLAEKLQVGEGMTLFLQLAHPSGRPVYLPAQVQVVFDSGFSELREGWLFCRKEALLARLGPLGPGVVEVFLPDPDKAQAFSHKLEASLGSPILVRSWSEMNRELFAALRWQKLTLALVFSLILGVGAFEVASSLVVLITEKRRELGILQAMGAKGPWVQKTVFLTGATLGFSGVILGLGLGLFLVGLGNLWGFPRFSPELAAVYMVQRIPWKLSLTDVLAVCGAGMAEVVIASLVTAKPLARKEPAEALRWV
jgi:lipoprotein-releasing system permease protein